MVEADREALIDRLKLASAWVAAAMEPTKPGDPEPEFCPLATVEDAIAAIAAMPTWRRIPDEVREGVAPRRWRHKKRGTAYTEVGIAYLQVATERPHEGDALVIYRGDDGKLWARTRIEFEDGRFEPIPPLPAPPDGEAG